LAARVTMKDPTDTSNRKYAFIAKQIQTLTRRVDPETAAKMADSSALGPGQLTIEQYLQMQQYLESLNSLPSPARLPTDAPPTNAESSESGTQENSDSPSGEE